MKIITGCREYEPRGLAKVLSHFPAPVVRGHEVHGDAVHGDHQFRGYHVHEQVVERSADLKKSRENNTSSNAAFFGKC